MVTYLSRVDGFANYAEATAAPASYEMAPQFKATFVNNNHYNVQEHNNADDPMPLVGQKNGMKLADLRGADYDDERWEPLLDQLTVDEMKEMIANTWNADMAELFGDQIGMMAEEMGVSCWVPV